MRQAKIEAVMREVISRVCPSDEEEGRVRELAELFKRRTEKAASEYLSRYEVRIEGSVAKGTWLRGEADVDIFLLMPTDLSREEMEEIGLKIAEKAFRGMRTIRRFAEHPYLEAEVDGMRVSIVPAYKVEIGGWRSAVDRTPYHTDYIVRTMSPEAKREVRVLKRFAKGIGVYGAEPSVKGFSGYLCELLVLHYGSFLRLVEEAASKWTPPVAIDVEGHYQGDFGKLIRLFSDDPLIVVDPVDPSRNVAAAVSPMALARFISACRWFLKTPSISFFFPARRGLNLEEELKRHGSIAAVILSHGEEVEDVLYPQLERFCRRLQGRLEDLGFEVFRVEPFSDYSSKSIVFVETASREIPDKRLHEGPRFRPLEFEESFVRKNLSIGCYVWIDERGEWKSIRTRRATELREAISLAIKEGAIPRSLRKRLFEDVEDVRIVYAEQLLSEGHEDEIRFLERFLELREFWTQMRDEGEN